jgi:hypothetical protein
MDTEINTLDDFTVDLEGFTLEEVNAFREEINGYIKSARVGLACLWAWPLLGWGFFIYNNYEKNTVNTVGVILLLLFTGVGLLGIALNKMDLIFRLWLSLGAFLLIMASDWLSWETGVFDNSFWCMGLYSMFAVGEATGGYVKLEKVLDKRDIGNTLSAQDRAKIKRAKLLDLLD